MEAEITRNTRETNISMVLAYPGDERKIDIGCGFFSHMLDLMCHRAGLGLSLKAIGDVEVDYHHPVEDIGICLGRALREIAGVSPIRRYGWCLLPMDGSLARVALDISGRGGVYWSGSFVTDRCGDFDLELIPEFFNALAREGGITLHIAILAADNSHHASEALFKGIGMALGQALMPALCEPSTKGVWL